MLVQLYTLDVEFIDPFSKIRSKEGLAEILSAYKAVLDSSSELGWVGIALVIFKI